MKGVIMEKNILIVDDDEMVRMALVELLRPEGYTLDEAGSGKEALIKIDQNKYDLMMFDIIMPEIDGLELCKRVRTREEYKDIPIVFLTAKSREQDKIKGLEAGANLFLSKPISPEKLLKIISETIGEK
jgi:two-component system, OmpR family, alkaline phosphatase synthesis response regulator PhoP